MKNPLTLRTNPVLKFSWLACALVGLAGAARAAELTWDSSGANPSAPVDGSGLWDTTSALWSNGAVDSAWVNAAVDTAVFGANNGAAGTVTVAEPITVGGITFNAAGSGSYVLTSGTITLAGTTPTITANGNATINSGLTGSAGLVKSGAGTLILGGVNSYSGGTVITSGTLQFSESLATNPGSLPGGTITLLDGATLQYAGTGAGGFNRSFILGTGTTKIASTAASGGLNSNGGFSFTGSGSRTLILETVSGNSMSVSGAIGDGTGGSTSLVKNGAGNVNLNSASNSYTGDTTVNGGILFTNGANRISTTGGVYISSGASIRLNGDQTIANLQDGTGGGGTLTRSLAGNSTVTIQSGSFSGKIDDLVAGSRTIAVVKSTAGVLRLSGSTNNYSMGTTVSAGTLLINNVSGNALGVGAVTVTSSTLGGNGIAVLGGANSISVGSGGVIAAGDSAVAGGLGMLTLNGGSTTGAILSMGADSSFTFDLASGDLNDTVRFYNYAGASDFLRDGSGITLNFAGAQEGSYDLFLFYSNAGTTLTDAGFDELTSNFVLGSGLSGYTATWDYGTTGVVTLNLTAVPEPAALGLVLVGLAAATVGRRRR